MMEPPFSEKNGYLEHRRSEYDGFIARGLYLYTLLSAF